MPHTQVYASFELLTKFRSLEKESQKAIKTELRELFKDLVGKQHAKEVKQ